MSDFLKMLCLLQHAPVEAAFESSSFSYINDTGGSDRNPLVDNWLHDNEVVASLSGSTGRVRGRAWGTSNSWTNFASSVGARFTFRYFVPPEDIVAGELYRFIIDLNSLGRFLHVAAVPRPNDDRKPPAVTGSVLNTQIDIFEISTTNGESSVNNVSEGGINIKRGNEFLSSNQASLQDQSTIIEANARQVEVINRIQTLAMNFRPTGNNPIICRVRRFVSASARGEYSDIRIRGAGGRKRFRVKAENPRIQKVLVPDDPCFEVLKA